MAQVVEINDPAELAGYRLLWTKLYSETAGASFFQSLDWLETYWRYHGDRQRLRVLVVYAAGEPDRHFAAGRAPRDDAAGNDPGVDLSAGGLGFVLRPDRSAIRRPR